MKALTQDINRVKAQKEFAWLITIVLIITGLPLLKNVIVFVLEKLYEIIIQRVIGR
jgi:hypothetical protein